MDIEYDEAKNQSNIAKHHLDFEEAAAQRTARTKKPVSIRLDADIIDFFKQEDVHYQSRINAVLRCYVDAMRG